MPSRVVARALPALVALAVGVPLTAAAATPAPPMPGLGPVGTATMHGDAQSSDTTPFAGPGTSGVRPMVVDKSAPCPTILAGGDGRVVALCTKIIDKSPVVLLLDPASGTTQATLPVAKGALLGGVYAYLDDRDRLVLVDGTNTLLRIAHRQDGGRWSLVVDERVPLTGFVTGDGTDSTDRVVGLVPDRRGHVWLATQHGRVGVLDPASGRVEATTLPAGERVDNSISASRAGVAIATSHALYVLDDDAGAPTVRWRAAYDRGTARKPGQLSWGTGATPTFFGPATGDEYVTITDNADGQEHLVVRRSTDGSLVCSPGVLRPGASGTENSPIATGSTVVVASTYGYPYPALPDGAGTSVPARAPFTGGMERYEVTEAGCTRSWSSPVASAAVPRLSLADGQIYTIERRPTLGATGITFDAVTIDATTGGVTSRTRVGRTLFQDSLQMVGTITPDRTWWQGTLSGAIRMAPR